MIYTHTTRAQQPANVCISGAKQGYGSLVMSELKAVNWIANNPSETITSTNNMCVCVSVCMFSYIKRRLNVISVLSCVERGGCLELGGAMTC